MSQYNNQRSSAAGRSRAKGSSHASRSNTRGSSRPGGVSRKGAGQYARKGGPGRKGGPDYDFKKIAAGGVILIAAIACIVFLVKGMGVGPYGEDSGTERTETEETQLQKEVAVDGVNITGMSREEARESILKNYPWGMKVSYDGGTYEVSDLMGSKLDSLLDEIYSGEPKERYSLDTSGLEDAIQAEAEAAAALWDKKAKNGSISSYDAASGQFLFTGAESGLALDREKLAADIGAALEAKDFDAAIEASVNPVEPEFSEEAAREKYKTLATFTTKTTANSKRNTNVKLSAQAINGKILQPGEEFSFNEVVGQRTEAKGYKGAAAYNNGEVVEEIGGGVCQVSSTLYNVVLRAGLETTVRRSHTFEPSYVTPGCDATVSWNGPDYKFVNNSSAAVGIRASYADRTVTISIYGIPVLEEGVKYTLESRKLKDIAAPAPVYEEDPTLEPGIEKPKSGGSLGSYWETRLVITKDGKEISREVDHNTTYKGHAPVVLRNTSGSVAPTLPGESEGLIDPSMESTPAPEGAGDGFDAPSGPGESQNRPSGPVTGSTAAAPGPGVEATAPAASQPPSTQAQTTAPASTQAPATEGPSAQQPAATQDDVQMIAPNPMG